MNQFQISSFKFHNTGANQQVTKSQQQPAASSQQPDRGFTLMEILLAFLILGIVVTTILASFNAVFSTTENLKNSSRR